MCQCIVECGLLTGTRSAEGMASVHLIGKGGADREVRALLISGPTRHRKRDISFTSGEPSAERDLVHVHLWLMATGQLVCH